MSRTNDYSQRLYQARDLQALRDLLQEVNEHANSDADFRPRNIRMSILRALRDATGDDLVAAREIILQELWPRCVGSVEEDDQPSSTIVLQEDGTQVWTPSRPQEAIWEAHEARELLGTWLAAWVEAEEIELRAEVVQKTCIKIMQYQTNVAAVQSGCWTLSSIGWRSQEVESLLWKIIERRDLGGDVAGGVLVALGLERSRRGEFIAQLKERAKERAIRYNSYPMIRLRTPELVEDALALFHAKSPLRWFDGRPRIGKENDANEMDLKLSFLSNFADSIWGDVQAQQQIWKEIFETCRDTAVGRRSLMFTGNLAPWCNTPEMIPDFLNMLPKILEDGKKESAGQEQTNADIDPTHFPVYIAAERLEAAVRPYQLEGWRTIKSDQLNPFKSIAFQDTHQTGYHTTSPMRAKESAWRFLALAGKRWEAADVQRSLSAESSGYVQGHIAEIVACFGCDPLPEIVYQTLTVPGQEAEGPRELDTGEDSSEFFAYRGMENIARTTANREAFDALLSFSYLYGGEMLRSTSDSVDEVAIYLVREKKDKIVVPKLWETIEAHKPKHKYIAAISALHALSAVKQLPTSDWEKFLPIARDTDLDDYFRALAVQAIGFMDDEFVASAAYSAIDELWMEARTKQRIELAGRAREALARHGTWDGERTELFLSDIGLEQREGVWRMKQLGTMESNDMAALFYIYKADKTLFQTAVCDILRSPRDEPAYALTFWLTRSDETNHITIDETVAHAMVDVLKATSKRGVRRYLLDALSLGAPDILLQEQWSKISAQWSTGARVALADAIGQTNIQPLPETAIQTLDQLAHDDAFEVRRATLRTFKAVAPNELQNLCEIWGRQSESAFERQIAAQGVYWTDGPFLLTDDSLSQYLLNDREPSVRKTAQESLEANREREWADSYLQQVEQASTQEHTPSNAFKFGAALERVGDDSHLRRLKRADTDKMSPPVRFWRRQIAEELEKKWREKTRKWDDLGEGAISETVEGRVIQGAKDIKVIVWLRLRPAAGVRGISGWGGRLRAKNDDTTAWPSIGEAHLVLDDGRKGDILIGNSNITIGADAEQWASFSGQGRFEGPPS